MKRTTHIIGLFLIIIMIHSCHTTERQKIEIYETSASGNKLTRLTSFQLPGTFVSVTLRPEESYQTITGIGGSFTEASASLLNKLSPENRNKILEAYFGDEGARYSLTRTHINSCDFSLKNYAYSMVENDLSLEHFSIEEDLDDIIPMIKDAQAISTDGFKIIATPWTAPPWMKDNQDWRGGKLLPAYYPVWALYFSKYLAAYRAEGINIWGITVENEPLGNDNNWESMHFTPWEMNDLVKNHLGPRLEADGHDVRILGFDQNRDEAMLEWVDVMYDDAEAAAYYDGTAVHWYASTYDYFPEALQYAYNKAPGKHLIQTEACVDAEVPVWQDDAWYWSKNAKGWGYTWAPEDQKHLHPPYIPVFRYARDIIGCLNNRVDGWIDWNMVLDRQGGPNWASNWCIAPVIVDPENDEVYFTPLYYTMAHFSRYIRPGAVRIGLQIQDGDVMATAVRNPDGAISVILFNPAEESKGIRLVMENQTNEFVISGKAIQTIVIPPVQQTRAKM